MNKHLGAIRSLKAAILLPVLIFPLSSAASVAFHEKSLIEGGEVLIHHAPALFENLKGNVTGKNLISRGPALKQSNFGSYVVTESEVVDRVEAEDYPDQAQLSFDEQTKPSKSFALNSSFVPLCQSLATGSLYTLSGVQAGSAYCYHFSIPQKSKSTVFLTGQSSATDFALYLFKDDGSGNLTVAGASNNPGNMDEVIVALTEAGEYYWYMEGLASDGSPIQFAAVPNFVIDDYELNDTFDLSYALPDKLNTVLGNSDSPQDFDYYHFASVRGQDVRVLLEGVSSGTSGNWILEYYDGSAWQAVSNESNINFGGIQPGQVVSLRVRPNPSAVWNANLAYRLVFGSKAVLSSYNVSGESNVLRVPYSAPAPTPYMTTQAYKQLSWSVRYTDSKGSPLAGVSPILYLWKRSSEPAAAYAKVTDGSGYASGLINLGDCVGDFQVEFDAFFMGQTNTWRTNYNFGQWFITVNGDPDLGVGSPSVPVTFGHLCSQRIVN